MKHACLGVAVALSLAAASPAAAQSSVSIQFQDGRVTLIARNAPLRTILTEWARVGGSRIVNVERVAAGAPMTLEYTNEPERQVLATLLRGIGGYAAAARTTALPGASSLDRIFLLTTPPLQQAASSSPTPAVQASPVVRFIPGEPDDDDLQDQAAARRADLQRLRDEAAAASSAIRDAQDDADGRRRSQPATVPGFPGGVIPGGGGRPGEITPAPRPQAPDSDEP